MSDLDEFMKNMDAMGRHLFGGVDDSAHNREMAALGAKRREAEDNLARRAQAGGYNIQDLQKGFVVIHRDGAMIPVPKRDYDSAVGKTDDEMGRRSKQYHDYANKGFCEKYCFLTTACVDVMGLPDDCFEMRVMRAFRDKVVVRTPEGRRAVQQYEAESPQIVAAVNEWPEAAIVWRWVYRDIRKAVRMIVTGNYAGAFEHYKQMTLRLKRDFV